MIIEAEITAKIKTAGWKSKENEELQHQATLTSKLDGGKWLALRPGHFIQSSRCERKWTYCCIYTFLTNRAGYDDVHYCQILTPFGYWLNYIILFNQHILHI
jgi:hypothetical protein